MRRRAVWVVLFAVLTSTPLYAQNAQNADAINDLKAKIFDARLAQRNFSAGLRHCSELNGTNFYFEQRDRVLNLQDYRRSLDNLVTQGAFNPETRRPWNKQDAEASGRRCRSRQPPIRRIVLQLRVCRFLRKS